MADNDVYDVTLIENNDYKNQYLPIPNVQLQMLQIWGLFAIICGSIVCTITGNGQYCSDLPQGGLKLPGPEDTMKKVKQRLIKEGKSVDDADQEIEFKVVIMT